MNFIKKLNQDIKCPNHFQQPCNIMCIDSTCVQNGLICGFCEQSHTDHKKIATKIFLQNLVNSFDYEQTSQKLVLLTLKIDLIFFQIEQEFKKLNTNYIDNLLKILIEFRQALKYEIFETTKIINQYKVNFESITFSQFNKQFRKNIFKFFSSEQDTDLTQNFIQKSFLRAQTKLKKIKQDIMTSIQKNNYTFQSLIFLLPLKTIQHVKFRFYFSDTNKGQGMKLNGLYQASMATSSSQRLMLLQPSLQKNSAIKTWKIKIVKLASWIGVGMCHLNLLKTANFNFNYTSTGHGNYLISSNGYSWSSLKPQYNSKYEPFTYTTGDTIQLQYNPKKKTLHFKKLTTQLQYTLEFDFISGDPLYPAVNLTGVGDCVEIIN